MDLPNETGSPVSDPYAPVSKFDTQFPICYYLQRAMRLTISTAWYSSSLASDTSTKTTQDWTVWVYQGITILYTR